MQQRESSARQAEPPTLTLPHPGGGNHSNGVLLGFQLALGRFECVARPAESPRNVGTLTKPRLSPRALFFPSPPVGEGSRVRGILIRL